MSEPTLQEVFGDGATQTIESIIVQKSDLADVGLTPLETNTAESLIAAILALAQKKLSLVNKENNPEQSVFIEDNRPNLITVDDITYRQVSKTCTFEKPDTQSVFNPDDY